MSCARHMARGLMACPAGRPLSSWGKARDRRHGVRLGEAPGAPGGERRTILVVQPQQPSVHRIDQGVGPVPILKRAETSDQSACTTSLALVGAFRPVGRRVHTVLGQPGLGEVGARPLQWDAPTDVAGGRADPQHPMSRLTRPPGRDRGSTPARTSVARRRRPTWSHVQE